MLGAAALTVRFLLELAMLVALAWAGWQVNVVLAVAAPAVAAAVWGMFVAPKARYPLPLVQRLGVEAVLFGAAIAALALAGHPWLALAFAAVLVADEAVVLWDARRARPSASPH